MKIRFEVPSLNYGIKIPWYMGFGKKRWDMDITDYYIIPLNFIVRFWERFRSCAVVCPNQGTSQNATYDRISI